MDTPGNLSGKRNCGKVDAGENSEELLGNQEKQCRAGDLHLAMAAERVAVKKHAL